MANKVYKDAKSALDGLLRDDLMLMCGGFGLVGMPDKLIAAVRDSGVKGLTCVSATTPASTARGSACCSRPARSRR